MTLFAPVTVYGQPACTPCERVKKMFDTHGVEYDYVDLSRNDEAKSYVVNVLKASSTPVIVTDTHEPIIGFQVSEINELIDYYKKES